MYKIRELEQSDLVKLSDVLSEQRLETDYPRLSLTIPNLAEWICNDEDAFNLVIEEKSEEGPLGHVAASSIFKQGSKTRELVNSLVSEEGTPWMEVKRLFVDLRCQGKGLGSILFLDALDKVWGMGHAPFVVVDALNGLSEWYIKHGGRIRTEFNSVNDGSPLAFIDFLRPIR